MFDFLNKTIAREHHEIFNTVRAAKDLRKQIGDTDCVYVCIGTDRATGDCLGPLVGSFLERYGISHVYGTLDEPVHAKNIHEVIDIISKKHEGCKVIAIDACLSRLSDVGYINIEKKSIEPGSGINKELPEIGDISITGNVNISGFMELMIIQNTRLSLVMNMARKIAQTILQFSISPCTEVAVTKLIESEVEPCEKILEVPLPF